MKKLQFIELICGLFIFLFSYTGINKLLNPETFRVTIESAGSVAGIPLITNNSHAISRIIPIIELLTAIILFIPRFRLFGLNMFAALMFSFTIYVGYLLTTVAPSSLPCSCGGILQQMTWKQHFIFNLSFTLLPMATILVIRHQKIENNRMTQTIKSKNIIAQ